MAGNVLTLYFHLKSQPTMPLIEAWVVLVKILLYKNITYDFVGKYEEFFAWTLPKKIPIIVIM